MTLAALAAFAACSGGALQTSTPANLREPGAIGHEARGARAAVATPAVAHVVIIIQENRTVDNLFQGYPGANTVSAGRVKGNPDPVPLLPVDLNYGQRDGCDLEHSHRDWVAAYDSGLMDGFENEFRSQCGATSRKSLPYSYVRQSEVTPYWAMAQQYYFNDNTFEDPTTPSFPVHEYLIAGQSADAQENPSGQPPWGCDAAPTSTVFLFNQQKVFPCFDYQTLADLLNAHAASWKYYAPQIQSNGVCPDHGCIWSAFDAIRHIRYGTQWKTNVVYPPSKIINDMQAGQTLSTVTWVTPRRELSDHMGGTSLYGPDYVAGIVNAIGNSKNWDSTVIFVVWDDWGGWYDHATPSPSSSDRLGGFRVPMLCISPFTQAGTLSHVQYELDSVLAFIEKTFPSIGTLNRQDAKDPPVADCLNSGSAVAQPFRPIATPAGSGAQYYFDRSASSLPPDE